MSSDLYHVIIVVEPARLEDYEIGTLADYIALLALTQMSSLDACQPLASIVEPAGQRLRQCTATG